MPLLFSSAAFLGAFLLFCVQPMIAKMLLPQFGGAPAVWNTCMVFFQTALLASYGFVHASSRWLGVRRQALLHLILMGIPFVALPFAVSATGEWEGAPALRLLTRLAAAVGLPFLVVATTAPTLQRWFAATSHPRARDPYFLYAASNAGSLLALVGYVVLIEPNLTLAEQARLWTAGYVVLAGLMAVCVAVVWSKSAVVDASGSPPARDSGITRGERARWVALALVPSSLMLGVTTYLTSDLAPVPLLWVIPLTLYLLSFIIAFASPPDWIRTACVRVLPVAIVVTLALMVRPTAIPLVVTLIGHLATFFLIATACHVDLARQRPAARHLTEFYLMISLGGVLGGLFNALVAPILFPWVAEYPLVLAVAALLVSPVKASTPPAGRRRWIVRSLDIALPLLLGLLTIAIPRLGPAQSPAALLLIPIAACSLLVMRPFRFALSLAIVAMVVVDVQDNGSNVVLRERTFFGVLRVAANNPPGMNSMTHGTTLHGSQRRSRTLEERRVPLLYYFPTGPIGQVFDAYRDTPVVRRVGVIGLGVGSLAGYGNPGDAYTFFEIDPAVERIARTPAYFRFLKDCLAQWRVVLGDARLSIARESDRSFGLIVLDAFSGDAIPVHLLTREALRIYVAKLAEGGLIAFHLSNRYLDLEPVVAELARDAALVGLAQNETTIPPNELRQARMASQWVVLARRQADLSRLAGRPGWRTLTTSPGATLWTDDYSDVFARIRWR